MLSIGVFAVGLCAYLIVVLVFVLCVMHSQIYLASQSWPLSKRKEVVVVSNSVDFLLRS